MKIYVGRRIEGSREVTVTDDRGTRMLAPRNDLVNHSPNGFEWGYWGSGPAQLALAILCDVLADDERADLLHQLVKERLIGSIKEDSWTLNEQQVLDAVREIEATLEWQHRRP